MSVRLAAHGWEAELRPDAGAAFASLKYDGLEVLRALPAGSDDPLESGCFPLVPYCNRIADARFAWGEESVQLPRNFPPEDNSLHGFGWQSEWSVEDHNAASCALLHEHDGSAWPWAYRTRQKVRLGASGLKVWLDVANLSDRPMPTGLGLHPYFRRRPETKVRFVAEQMVEVDDRLIPTGALSASNRFADWSGGTALPDGLVDHCFTGWNGRVEITDDLGSITMTARGAPFLHVYSPADGSALCFEPVSHLPDALNQFPQSMTLLPPGCTASMEMAMGVG